MHNLNDGDSIPPSLSMMVRDIEILVIARKDENGIWLRN